MPKKTTTEQLLENAFAPKSAEVDGQKVEQHSLEDQIKAIKIAASMEAARSRHCGIRVTKMRHGGAE